ncbi:MAG TPA: sn-glycerol-1-phosphate dehydrogenase [Mobilitalea sp.]|nr:sn-glycerol-1-phosphate dehydrogenase [Mobilitalea sp.]
MFKTDQFTISDYLGKTFSCECNRQHSVPIKYILIEEGASLALPDLIKSNGFQKSFLLYDSTTYSIAGTLITSLMEQSQLPYTSYILKEAEPTPDEKALGDILIHFDPSCDIIIAVGSGTLNDLCRFISYKMNLPYMIVATAPSMDGFASNVAPLIVNHMKTTYEAHVPFAILGDTNIIKDAPMNMIAAGIGDILGKYTCLCEWEIAHIITGEYHCTSIESIVKRSLETVVANINNAKHRTPEAAKSIMEALVLSGIAMSFAGNSRPASGSEHHLSHYWEMMYLFQGKQPVLHGTKVGIGTVAVIKAYELLMSRDIDFKKAKEAAKQYSKEQWKEQMTKTYYSAADSVIELEDQIGKNDPEHVIPRIRLLQDNWDKLKEVAGHLPSSDTIRNYLDELKAPSNPMAVGIDKTTFINSFLVAKELRNRFGLLQILFDLGLTEEIAEEVWMYFMRFHSIY